MNFAFLKSATPRLQRSAVALALAAIGASASALPVFTLNPDGAIAGAPTADITADNILISDFSTVRFGAVVDGMRSFTDSGYLDVTGFQLGNGQVATPGLGTTYGMYFKFTGSGTVSAGDPRDVPTNGVFTTLTYELYGYTGQSSFGFNAGNDPTENVSGDVLLAFGSLRGGTVASSPDMDGPLFSPNANASLTFNIAAGAAADAFFVAPDPYYSVALAAFINTPSQVTFFDGGSGFRITQGGGAVNFAAPIPEPETYALMLAGLAAVGFVARRRRPQT